jgi:hypothetical protein
MGHLGRLVTYPFGQVPLDKPEAKFDRKVRHVELTTIRSWFVRARGSLGIGSSCENTEVDLKGSGGPRLTLREKHQAG